MFRILIADGAPLASQLELEPFGAPTNQALFEAALRLHDPGAACTSINIADGEALPPGIGLEDFDGVMFTGSPLHIYDTTPPVTRQIEFARTVFETDVPVWGSCWGVQLGSVALGGSVRRNPHGRELGVARRILLTDSGRSHPVLAGRPLAFDALCSHLDEVETLPPDGLVLASNEMSRVQALAAPTPGGGVFTATQYHPEHSLAVSAAIIQIRAALLVREGLGHDVPALLSLADDYRALDADPGRYDLAWRYGLDATVLDPQRRTAEIGNWLRSVVAPRRASLLKAA